MQSNECYIGQRIMNDTAKFFHFTYSLKRTNSVLQEHEEALQKKIEMVLAKLQQVRQELDISTVLINTPRISFSVC